MRNKELSFRGGPLVDMPLLLAIVAIATCGLVNLYSATSAYIGSGTHGKLADIYVSQIYWIVVGVLLGVLTTVIDYRFFERWATILYWGGLGLLGLVWVLGTDIRGASRWIQLGSVSIQPSEFMKIALVLMIARYVHNDPQTEPRTLIDLAPPVVFALIPAGAVMIQPDLGTATILLVTALSIIAMTRVHRRTVTGALFVLGVGAPLFWYYRASLLHGYQLRRLESFVNPEADKTGAAWHALQAQTAIGNGGLVGEGFMQGTQNQFGRLPDQFSDFPFAVFAEDWGLVGCFALLALYAFVCIWAVHIASEARDRFGAALAIGVGALFFWHTLFNLGMAIGLLPVVGITLPLFSYGGSSVVTTLMSLGFLMNVSMRR